MINDWKKTLLTQCQSISKAIEVLEESTLKIILVAENDLKLQGVVTDGDIRRAVLRNLPLSTPIAEIMNRNPKTSSVNEKKEAILEKMQQFKLLHIPVVSEGSTIVGLESLHDVSRRKKFDNPVFLMAGGEGKRLRPLTEDTPKPLLKVAGVPILESILHQFIESGFHRFYISICYKAEMITDYFGDGSKWGVTIDYIQESSPLGTAGSLGLLPEDAPDLPLILMNSDLLTRVNFEHLLSYHREHDEVATMCVRHYEVQVPYGVIETKGTVVHKLVEKPTQSYLVNAGIYILGPEVYKSIRGDEKVDITDVLENEIKNGREVSLFPLHESWLDIGRKEDLSRARSFLGEA